MIHRPGPGGGQHAGKKGGHPLRGNAAGFHLLHDPAEAGRVHGIELRFFTELRQLFRGDGEHPRAYRAGSEDDHRMAQELQLHAQGFGIFVQGRLGDGVDPGEGQDRQGRKLAGDDEDIALTDDCSHTLNCFIDH